MGMYTELVLGINIKGDAPKVVLDALLFMTGVTESKPTALPDHPLFLCPRWEYMLRCDSYYFAGCTHTGMWYDGIGKKWEVSIRCNFKNYEDELDKFLDWVRPYIEDPIPGEFMGYSRYEEAEQPTLLYV